MTRCLRLVAALLVLATAPNAHAVFRAYVSGAGNDANPCSVAAPCRLLPAALAAVDLGGEIWMLDSANYNTATVTITKSVSILAVPGVVGSVVATGGGAGLVIQAPGSAVSLRNLAIVHLGASSHGIDVKQAASFDVADCEVANVQGVGIYAESLMRLAIRDCDIHGVAQSGILIAGNAFASIERTTIRGGLIQAILAMGSSNVSISASRLVHNGSGLRVAGGNPTRVTVDDTLISGNAAEGVALVTPAPVQAMFTRTAIVHNNVGLSVESVGGTVLSECTVSGNAATGVLIVGAVATVSTLGNNTLELNGTDVSGGTLALIAAK